LEKVKKNLLIFFSAKVTKSGITILEKQKRKQNPIARGGLASPFRTAVEK